MMRIAGSVPRSQKLDVEYTRSVHTVSRWIHELFEADDVPGGEPTLDA